MKAWKLTASIFIGMTMAGLTISAANWYYIDYKAKAALREAEATAAAINAEMAAQRAVNAIAQKKQLAEQKKQLENHKIQQAKLDTSCNNWKRWYREESSKYNKMMMDDACNRARQH